MSMQVQAIASQQNNLQDLRMVENFSLVLIQGEDRVAEVRGRAQQVFQQFMVEFNQRISEAENENRQLRLDLQLTEDENTNNINEQQAYLAVMNQEIAAWRNFIPPLQAEIATARAAEVQAKAGEALARVGEEAARMRVAAWENQMHSGLQSVTGRVIR